MYVWKIQYALSSCFAVILIKEKDLISQYKTGGMHALKDIGEKKSWTSQEELN